MAPKSFVFRSGDLEVREREFSLTRLGETLPVEPKAFRVLLILLRNPQKLISKEELLNAVWGETAVSENSLTRSIALLRRLLGDDARNPRLIETVATVGYRWMCAVEAAEDLAAVATAPEPLTASGSEETANGVVTPLPGGEGLGRTALGGRRMWMFAVGAVALGLLAGGMWYFRHPLPPPLIVAYSQITHDGREKELVGTDGSRLYFTQEQPKALAEIGISGGEVAQIPSQVPGIFHLADVAPDGSNLLVQGLEEGGVPDAPLFNVATLGGTPRRVAYADSAAFSPDGSWIAYATNSGELWLVRSDGTGAHKLDTAGNGNANPHWSPDGGMIGFDKHGSLWAISPDGSKLHEMVPGWHASSGACCGHWTPDGKFYLFLASPSVFARGQIWVLDERRGPFRDPPAEPVQLTPGPISWSQPIPGKDGKTIFSAGQTGRGELCRFDSMTKQLLPYLGGISAEDVSFSRDGRSVSYVSYPDGLLWRANRDGSNPVQLSQPPIYAVNPRWSPDGTQILFSDARESEEEPGAHKIYKVSSEGGSPEQLLPDDPDWDEDPNWSADGHQFVFYAFPATEPTKGGLRIFDLSSRKVTSLAMSAGLWSPRWSPDGKYITAMSRNFAGLKVLDIATQHWLSLPVSGRMDYPMWSSDSQSIYFLRLINGDRGVYRVHVKSGKIERVVDLKDWHITGLYTFWMALDPTDAPLLLRDTGVDNIYALTLGEK